MICVKHLQRLACMITIIKMPVLPLCYLKQTIQNKIYLYSMLYKINNGGSSVKSREIMAFFLSGEDAARAFTVSDKIDANIFFILISNTSSFRCISLHQSVNYKPLKISNCVF